MKNNEVPLLLKKVDTEIDDLIQQAFTYLMAYDETRDWGYIPTVQNALGKISIIHMRRSKDATSGCSE